MMANGASAGSPAGVKTEVSAVIQGGSLLQTDGPGAGNDGKDPSGDEERGEGCMGLWI